MAVGRITGPLLKANLTRNGVPLAVETDLLYLDVVNQRVGINTSTPTTDLHVNGTVRSTNLTVPGTSLFGTIQLSGNTISSSSNTINLLPSGGTNPVVYQATVEVGNMQLQGSTISTTGTNTNITLTTTGTGTVNLQGPTTVSGNLHVTGNITADGNIQLGATINVQASGLAGSNQITVASSAGINVGYLVYGNGIGSGAIVTAINGNVLTLSQPNTSNFSNSVTFQANVTVSFSGEVASDLVPLVNNFYNIGAPNAYWANLYSETILTNSATIGGISISGNSITTNTTNSDITFSTSGTGGIVLGNLRITGSTITDIVTNDNITLTPQGTGYVSINSTTSLQIPVGTSLERPMGANGMIRYNTDLSRYEGYTSGLWLQLGGVTSYDGKTYITPELTPGAGDNTIRFYANNTLVVTIDPTKLYTPVLQTSQLNITTNTISTLTAGTDIVLNTQSTGGFVLGNLRFYQNSITNILSGGITTFTETGSGYVKIAGSNGVVIPSGNGTTQRPAVYETGMIRFNTDAQYVEIWNGTAWTSIAGANTGVTASTAQDIGVQIALMLG